MSAASQQAGRGSDVLLQVRRWLPVGFMFIGGGRRCLFRRAGFGGRYQLVVRWRGSWRGVGEELSQVAGVRNACSQVVRMAGAKPGGQALPVTSVLEVGGAKPQQDRLDDRCVIEQRVRHRPGATHGDTISAGTRTP
jgi:hypothetical protein